MTEDDDLKRREAILAEIFGDGIPGAFLADYGPDLTKGTPGYLRHCAERFVVKDYARLLAKVGDNK